MRGSSPKRWFYLGLVATITLVVVSQMRWPTLEEAAQERCISTYGQRDWDVAESLSWSPSSAIKELSCYDQHATLNQLANIPSNQRNDWLDRLMKMRHQSPLSSNTAKQ
jgi:hypothetical protein